MFHHNLASRTYNTANDLFDQENMIERERNRYIRVIKDLRIRETSLNLALEEAVSRFVSEGYSPPTIRFWRDDKSVIIGRSQNVFAEVDLAFCEDNNIPIFRRVSGGGAVIHHKGNLNYSVYLPRPLTSRVKESSLKWNKLTGRTLLEEGLPSDARENGLFIDGFKVGGSAQSRRWGLLHHGTLLVNPDKIMDRMDSVLKAPRRNYKKQKKAVSSEPSDVSDLESLAGNSIHYKKLIDSLVLKLSLGIDLTPKTGSINSAEIRLAKWLKKSKYGRLKADKKGIKDRNDPTGLK